MPGQTNNPIRRPAPAIGQHYKSDKPSNVLFGIRDIPQSRAYHYCMGKAMKPPPPSKGNVPMPTQNTDWLDHIEIVPEGVVVELLNAPQPASRRNGRMNELRAAINEGRHHSHHFYRPENLADMNTASMTRALTIADVQLARDVALDVRGAWSELKGRIYFAYGRHCHSYLADYVRAIEAGKVDDRTARCVAEQADQVAAHMEAIVAACEPEYAAIMRGVTADPTTHWQAYCKARDDAEEQVAYAGHTTMGYYVVEMAHFYRACAARLRAHERAKLQAHLDQRQAA